MAIFGGTQRMQLTISERASAIC